MVKKREIKITSSSQENPSADNELLEQQSGVSTSVPNPTTDWFNVSVSFKNKNFKVSIDYRSIQHRFSPWLVEISPSILICRLPDMVHIYQCRLAEKCKRIPRHL